MLGAGVGKGMGAKGAKVGGTGAELGAALVGTGVGMTGALVGSTGGRVGSSAMVFVGSLYAQSPRRTPAPPFTKNGPI
jgi:hypothetical protein